LIKRQGLFPHHQFATREKNSNWTSPRSRFEENYQTNQNSSLSLTGSLEGKFQKENKKIFET